MGIDWKSLIGGMMWANGKPLGKVVDVTCSDPNGPWAKASSGLTIDDLLKMQTLLPPRPPRLSDKICQGCGAEFRPGMPRSVQLADTGGYVCAVCGDRLRELCKDTSAALVKDGDLYVYRGPADQLQAWCRHLDALPPYKPHPGK